MEIKDIKITKLTCAKVNNRALNLKLLEESELAFKVGQCSMWEKELQNGWIVTKWYKTNKKGTSYKIKPAEDQAEYDENVAKFIEFKKEIKANSEIEFRRAIKVMEKFAEEGMFNG